MDKIQSKQTAKKGWVNDFVYEILSKNNEQYNKIMGDIGSELTFEMAIMKQILINKLKITEADVDEAEKMVIEQQKVDSSLIKKYKNDHEKSIEEKLKLMKDGGMSERGLIRMEYVLKEMEKSITTEDENAN